MSKKPTVPKPIMKPDEERYMAFSGLIQWTNTVILQSARTSAAQQYELSIINSNSAADDWRLPILDFQSECHFFAVAAHKLIEFKDWVLEVGLCRSVNFDEVNSFDAKKIRDLRNMREHVTGYFRGFGLVPQRWILETPEFSADASSVAGTMIGGRLDWVAFGGAAERLLPQLLGLPIPYPPT